MEIIGLLGHQGVGKNYIAEKIIQIDTSKPTLIVAFADHFKIDCVAKHGLKYEKVFHKKDEETRHRLQQIGTEEGRDVYGENIWVNVLDNWMRTFYERGIKRFIIADVRFQNEVDWIKSLNGIVIKVVAPTRYRMRLEQEIPNQNEGKIKEMMNHRSEAGIDKIETYDFEFHNDIGDDFENEISKLLNNK